jgi:glycosyltransferase involved in cell wall biosynthesis
MRFCVIGPVFPYRGGIAHHTTYLIQALQANHHVVQVVSFHRQYPGWLYPGQSDRDPSAEPNRVDAEFILDPFSPGRCFQAAQFINNFHPDLTIIQWWTTFWAPADALLACLLRRRGHRVSFLIHNTLPHELKLWDPLLAKLALRQGQYYVVQTDAEGARLRSLLPDANIRLCLMPIFRRFKEQKTPREEARRRLGLQETSVILLFFGIVRRYKGLSHLLKALSILKQKGIQVRLIIAGEFWEDLHTYQNLIAAWDLIEQVTIDNRYIPDEEAHLLLSAADVLVAPYTAGTQSAAAALGIGYGLPLILTEQVARGINLENLPWFRVVPPGDPPAIAQAVQNLSEEINFLRTSIQDFPEGWSRIVSVFEELTDPNPA